MYAVSRLFIFRMYQYCLIGYIEGCKNSVYTPITGKKNRPIWTALILSTQDIKYFSRLRNGNVKDGLKMQVYLMVQL